MDWRQRHVVLWMSQLAAAHMQVAGSTLHARLSCRDTHTHTDSVDGAQQALLMLCFAAAQPAGAAVPDTTSWVTGEVACLKCNAHTPGRKFETNPELEASPPGSEEVRGLVQMRFSASTRTPSRRLPTAARSSANGTRTLLLPLAPPSQVSPETPAPPAPPLGIPSPPVASSLPGAEPPLPFLLQPVLPPPLLPVLPLPSLLLSSQNSETMSSRSSNKAWARATFSTTRTAGTCKGTEQPSQKTNTSSVGFNIECHTPLPAWHTGQTGVIAI